MSEATRREITNPHDRITIDYPDPEAADLAVIVVGQGSEVQVSEINDGGPAFPRVGKYAVHKMSPTSSGVLVYIKSKNESGQFGVEYVQRNGDPGGSSYYWKSETFSTIECPIQIASSRIHEAKRQCAEARRLLDNGAMNQRIWESALEAIEEAGKARSK